MKVDSNFIPNCADLYQNLLLNKNFQTLYTSFQIQFWQINLLNNEGYFNLLWLCRRSISNFYSGKSKSFTSLADVVTTPSVKDIVKPENAYTRRRRNLLAFNHGWDKNKNFPLRSNSGGISKRTMSLSRSALALAVALSNSDSSSSFTSDDSATSTSYSSAPSSPLPPRHPGNRVSSLASPLQRNFFSLADLHHCAIAATMKMPSSSIENETTHHPS